MQPSRERPILCSHTAQQQLCHTSKNKHCHQFYRPKLHRTKETFIRTVVEVDKSLMKPFFCEMKSHHNLRTNPKYCFMYVVERYYGDLKSRRRENKMFKKNIKHYFSQGGDSCRLFRLAVLIVSSYLWGNPLLLMPLGLDWYQAACDTPWVAEWDSASG